MRRFKERRFWFNMLFSYLVIALLCFTLYMTYSPQLPYYDGTPETGVVG